jgi:hypothetical protein
MNFRLLEGETILKEGKANRCGLVVAQGGTLALTNKRLVFVGHGKNIGEGTVSISLDEVLTCGKAFTFSLFVPIPIPNAIKVVLQNGKKFRFTVFGRQKWLSALQKAMK